MIKAVKSGSYRQVKEGAGKGKTFYIFNVIGTKEELQDYVNSPQFKQYPLHAEDGTPQFRTMYLPLMDTCPLYKKQDGNYTIDESEINDDLTRMSDDRVKGTALEQMFAEKVAQKVGIATTPRSYDKFQMPATEEKQTSDVEEDIDNM